MSAVRRVLTAVAAATSLAVGPPSAGAHIRPSGRWLPVASDYRGGALGTDPPRAGVSAQVVGGDQSLRLRVDRGTSVVVLGVLGEPFLRFAGGHVEVNQDAPTAYAQGLGRAGGGQPVVDAQARPTWRRVATGSAYTWHDHRLRPPALRGGATRAGWTIPLRVDGRAARLLGRTVHAPVPSIVPFAVLVSVLAAVGIALAFVPSRALRRGGGAILAAGSMTALLVAGVGTWLDAPRSAGSTAGVLAAGVALLGLACALLALADRGTAGLVTLAVALLAIGAAATFAPVLTHAYPLSALPAWLARTTVCIAMGLGLAAAIVAAGDVVRATVAAQAAPGAHRA